ncbi:Putative integral membrane protein [Fulvivirga imtechensis AK7]|uniref:Putative integral membrane protein n=1 Tax=Fulvivirga imtechensis AK7 TaxID=1237149 RepID=L8JLP2_9BACT|nr:VanZ family protein [Fulvivirga imtechensis]ELR69725.1 Putative integral membrane protein [Fulvivirga imtechensis AK7]
MPNKYLIGSILWAIVILVLTLTPGESVPDLTLFSYDKLGHGFVFFVLAFLLISGLYESRKDHIKRNSMLTLGVILSALYGFLIELAQAVIPGRSMEMYDALANIAGSFLGLCLFYIRNKYKA